MDFVNVDIKEISRSYHNMKRINKKLKDEIEPMQFSFKKNIDFGCNVTNIIVLIILFSVIASKIVKGEKCDLKTFNDIMEEIADNEDNNNDEKTNDDDNDNDSSDNNDNKDNKDNNNDEKTNDDDNDDDTNSNQKKWEYVKKSCEWWSKHHQAISVAALIVNIFVLAFASYQMRELSKITEVVQGRFSVEYQSLLKNIGVLEYQHENISKNLNDTKAIAEFNQCVDNLVNKIDHFIAQIQDEHNKILEIKTYFKVGMTLSGVASVFSIFNLIKFGFNAVTIAGTATGVVAFGLCALGTIKCNELLENLTTMKAHLAVELETIKQMKIPI